MDNEYLPTVNTDKSLVSLEQDLQKVFWELEENGGEITPEINAQLEVLVPAIEKKTDNVAFAYNDMDASINGLKMFIQSAQAKLKAKENAKESFRNYIAKVLDNFGSTDKKGKKQFKGQIVTIKQTIKQSVEVESESLLPDDCKLLRITLEIPYSKLDSFSDFEMWAEMQKYAVKTENGVIDKKKLTQETPGTIVKETKSISIYGLKKMEIENEE